MKWTESEEKYIFERYKSDGIMEVAKALKRSEDSVRVKAFRMGIKTKSYYTQQEIQFLQENLVKHGIKYCAEKLGRSYESVKVYANTHGLYVRKWTKQQREYITENAHLSNRQIAKKIGKTSGEVNSFRIHNNIGTQIDNIDGLTIAEAERIIGVPRSTLRKQIDKGNYKIKKYGRYTIITFEELEKYMCENPNNWNATKAEKEYFMQYKWFREKRDADIKAMKEKRWGKVV